MKRDRLRLHALWNSLANSTASPFVGFNVTAAGASDILIGYVQAISTLASAVAQLFGGRVADRSGKRIQIAILFSNVTGALWIVSALVRSAELLAVTFTAITIAAGLYAAGWSSVLGEASEGREKGAFLSSFARLQSIGSLIALILTTGVTAFYPSYTFIYLLSGLFFFVSAWVLSGEKEQTVEKNLISSERLASLRKYYAVSAVYGLFWGFAWPLFTITVVKVVKMNLFEFSFSQVIAVGATIGFQPLVGRLVDRDRRGAVVWGRLGLVVYPVAYMLFTAAWQVYLVNAFSGFTNALLNVAFVAYLYDIVPAGQRGRYSAEFNLIVGVTTMAGSLASAAILTYLTASTSLWLSLAYLYVVAAIGRGLAGGLHLILPRATSVSRVEIAAEGASFK